jgi:hypothetical protein
MKTELPVTIDQAAEALGVSEAQVRTWMKNKWLQSATHPSIEGELVMLPDDIPAFLARQTKQSEGYTIVEAAREIHRTEKQVMAMTIEGVLVVNEEDGLITEESIQAFLRRST